MNSAPVASGVFLDCVAELDVERSLFRLAAGFHARRRRAEFSYSGRVPVGQWWQRLVKGSVTRVKYREAGVRACRLPPRCIRGRCSWRYAEFDLRVGVERDRG
ncbi:hypothetical protein FMEAI12_2890009 [Parafrankia sp. Ea1.12]|nr:hypothetical protein FMEAI12_2890009 [Parafrankia sp. Ea1.12]